MRRRAWLWVLGTLGVILLALGGIVWDVHRRAEAVLEAHRKEAQGLAARFRSRDFRRPPLDGEGVDGNAWELYAAHLPSFVLPAEEETEIPEVDGTWEPERRPDDEVLDVLYLIYAPRIEGLREALRRKEVDPRFAYEQGMSLDAPLISPSIVAAKVLAGGMAHHHRMGRGGEALDLAALGLGLAQDQRPAVLGLLVRIVIEGIIGENLQTLLADHRLSAGDLERFAGKLDRLDAARPTPAAAWDEEDLFLRFNLASPGLPEAVRAMKFMRPENPDWRQLWSWKIAQAQALSKVSGCIEEGRRLLTLPTPTRVVEATRLERQWENETTPLLRNSLVNLPRAFRKDVESLTLRILLRVSVALAWYEAERGEFPLTLRDLVPRHLPRVVPCPYSGLPLGYKGGAVWSPGANGVDDGGVGDPLDPRLFDKAGSDVVCTVKRRK